jgi:hypothetical protein
LSSAETDNEDIFHHGQTPFPNTFSLIPPSVGIRLMAIIMRYILSSIYIPHLLSHHPDPVEIHRKQKLPILQTHAHGTL